MDRMHIPDAVRALERDLRDIFGGRLRSLVVYQPTADDERTPTLVIVDSLSAEDLQACAGRVGAWNEAGLDTPLLVAAHEFERSLDAFPFEFGAILADHRVAMGPDPFTDLTIDPAHLRHACEIQARSHLLHLREGFLEARGRGDRLAELILRSATPLIALIKSVARLQNRNAADAAATAATLERDLGLPDRSLAGVAKLSGGSVLSSDEARRLFPGYLEAVARLTTYIDAWQAS
jgi:hypothetical protein